MHPLAFFFLSTMAIQGDIKESSGLSLLFALWICRWLKGNWLSLLIALFPPEKCNKLIELRNQEQNCNKITLLMIFLFISWACLSLQRKKKKKGGRWKCYFAKQIILFIFRFQLNDITRSAREFWLWVKMNFVHFSIGNIFAKPLSCTPNRIKQML